VKEADVDAVMSAYNTLNGDSCSQNKRLLTAILRDEWQFDGMVVSDWGAVTNDAAAVEAGNNLKMPGFKNDPARIEQAIKEGRLAAESLDNAVRQVVAFLLKANAVKKTDAAWGKGMEDFEQNHALARKIAGESIVLLKNDGVLPLKKQSKLLIIGEYAKSPHFQGGGSSHVNSYKVDGTLELFEQAGWAVTYIEDFSDTEAILSAAKTCDTAIVFAGTPESEESEGFDRETLDLPEIQNRAIFALDKAKIPTVTVLFEGSAVAMPWVNEVNGILAAFLPGESGDGAVFDILSGAVNPSGKLAETFPERLCDTPAYLTFPGEGDFSFYGESLFVGYRYYEKKQIKPIFCFGHGLSYTNFTYSDLRVN
jgi:beta-glucosidase